MKYIVFWLLIITSTVLDTPQKDEFGRTEPWSNMLYKYEVNYEPHYKEFTDRQEALDFYNRAKKQGGIYSVAIDSIEVPYQVIGTLYWYDTLGYDVDSITSNYWYRQTDNLLIDTIILTP